MGRLLESPPPKLKPMKHANAALLWGFLATALSCAPAPSQSVVQQTEVRPTASEETANPAASQPSSSRHPSVSAQGVGGVDEQPSAAASDQGKVSTSPSVAGEKKDQNEAKDSGESNVAVKAPGNEAAGSPATPADGMVGETVGDVRSALPDVSLESVKNLPVQKVRDQLDRALWKDEVLSQDHEMTFVDLWDALRDAKGKFAVLGAFPFDQLTLHDVGSTKSLPWDIELLKTDGAAKTYSPQQFKEWLATMSEAGYELVELEFHHSKFDRAKEGVPAKSVMNSVFHVVNKANNERIVIRGELHIVWTDKLNDKNHPIVASMEANNWTILRRKGEPVFSSVGKRDYIVDQAGSKAPPTTHPIMTHDLNRDGLDELIVGGFNEIHWNKGKAEFEQTVLCKESPRWVNGGVIADFTGDGFDDLLLGLKENLPALYVGDESGHFDTPPQYLTAASEKLRAPSTITAGDVDGDGDVDVWIGQYRPPYLDGHMPTPYYDANDGFPAYLFLNDGRGDFVDATESSGLAPKRFRRMYSSSLVDLNDDGKLDLICVSDFAGIDLYYNQGNGVFKDVTSEALPQQDAFGMSHSFGDYNQDGRLDFFVIGMSSTTARRLDYLRLGRDDFSDRTKARSEMGYGNRMMLGTPGGSFVQAPNADQVARSGWSWGSGSFDADNDGDTDLYVCNGHMSGRSCKDYCTRYWTQDIYDGNSKANADLKSVFALSLKDLNNLDISWNGFEHNVLWMSEGNTDYFNIAFLMGVAFEFDARSLVVNDFDADGKMDLIVEEFNRRENRHTLHLMKNNWPSDANHWIGVTLTGAKGISPVGAKLVCKTKDREYIAQNVRGHSVWAQHSDRVHWGIGKADAVESLIVRWPNGQESKLDNPQVDKYHAMSPPVAEAAAVTVNP